MVITCLLKAIIDLKKDHRSKNVEKIQLSKWLVLISFNSSIHHKINSSKQIKIKKCLLDLIDGNRTFGSIIIDSQNLYGTETSVTMKF